jgi:23S rRNA (uracil1939-C5)-methyltransferase
LRHLIVREGVHTGEILVGLVAPEDHPVFGSLGPLLAERVPALVGLVLILNRKKAAVARGESERVLWGRPYLQEKLAGLTFELSVQSFFQTNTLGAEALIGAIRSVLGPLAGGKLLDLYCGPGTLSLALADSFSEVLGVEQLASAVGDARRNAERNGITHARFLEAVVEQWLAVEAIGGAGSIHGFDGGVLVDPPRAGLHPKAVKGVLGLRPPWILYVSCNPSTLARDAALFVEGGYRPGRMQIVDMFPHTAHVETVMVMERGAEG